MTVFAPAAHTCSRPTKTLPIDKIRYTRSCSPSNNSSSGLSPTSTLERVSFQLPPHWSSSTNQSTGRKPHKSTFDMYKLDASSFHSILFAMSTGKEKRRIENFHLPPEMTGQLCCRGWLTCTATSPRTNGALLWAYSMSPRCRALTW